MRGVAGDGADPAPTPQTPLLPCSEENLAQIWLHASGSLGGTFQPSRGMLHPPLGLQPPIQMCQGRRPPEPGPEITPTFCSLRGPPHAHSSLLSPPCPHCGPWLTQPGGGGGASPWRTLALGPWEQTGLTWLRRC